MKGGVRLVQNTTSEVLVAARRTIHMVKREDVEKQSASRSLFCARGAGGLVHRFRLREPNRSRHKNPTTGLDWTDGKVSERESSSSTPSLLRVHFISFFLLLHSHIHCPSPPSPLFSLKPFSLQHGYSGTATGPRTSLAL